MALKKGASCFRADVCGTKIEFTEFVLRTIRTARGVYSWEKPQQWAFWWAKVPGLSWGKRSRKHGDWGFLKNADPVCREKHLLSSGRPYAATKQGAIRDEIAVLRSLIKDHGEDCDFYEEGATLGQQLRAAQTYQKRMKGKRRPAPTSGGAG